MNLGLRSAKALITGGASGIGLGIASVLAEEGVDLAIASRNPPEEALESLRARGARVARICADVSRESEVIRMVDEAFGQLGGLDFYVNNAAWTCHQPITRLEAESWHKTLDTNLSAAVFACREVSRRFIAQKRGSIVIIGSTARFFPAYQEIAYRCSKMGLKMLMEGLAIELAPYGVRVNMVTPGHYKTRMTGNIPEEIEAKLRSVIPLRRFGETREVGNAVAFLLSDTVSAYTTGGDIVVDGGLTLHPLLFMTDAELSRLNS